MTLRKGDQVEMLDEKIAGVICEVLANDFVLVELEQGLKIKTTRDNLIPKGGNFMNQVVESNINIERVTSQPASDKDEQRKGRSKVRRQKKKASADKTVDLHIDILVDDYRNLTNTEKLNIQLNQCTKELKDSIRKKHRVIIFIHGVGNGTLKREVRNLILQFDGAVIEDASYAEYGRGATKVILRYNF